MNAQTARRGALTNDRRQRHGLLRVYIDMDGVLCDIAAAYQKAAYTHPDVEYPQSIPGLFASLAPMPGAIDAVTQLRTTPGLDVWILSAPSTRNPACYSEKRIWVEKVFDYPLAQRLILATDKSLLRGDILIDDNLSGKGQERFEGELIHFGSTGFPTWHSVLDYIRFRLRSATDERGETRQPPEDRVAPVDARPSAAPWRVRFVEALPDYCVRVVFNDGLTGTVRMRRLIESDTAGVFAGLSDPGRFAQVRVELGVVTWTGGVDLAPDAMYDAIADCGEWVP